MFLLITALLNDSLRVFTKKLSA